jgi:beta-glucosidase-like glycosyl hydrolase
MSERQRWFAARSIIARLDVPRYWQQPAYREQVLGWVEQGLAGVCLFGGTVEAVERVVVELLGAARVPIVIAADLEYGLPMRFSGGTAFPRAFALGRAGRPEWTAQVAAAIARQARQLGIGWNFAPVCDVATNPGNPVIGIRAFGHSVEEALPHIRAWIEATQAEGVWACAKHFPGHGDVVLDSHVALPTVEADREQLWQRELEPFRAAIAAGVAGIMLGHLRVPALGMEELPASLSAQAVRLLRQELGYDGLIVTDALDMGAITQRWSTAEAVEQALRAGVDLLLMPADVEEALAAATQLLQSEPALLAQRRESLARLQRMREHFPYAEEVELLVESPDELRLAVQVAKAAVRVEGEASLVPLPADAHLAVFACLAEAELTPATLFFHLLARSTHCPCDMAYLTAELTEDEEQRLHAATQGATHAVVVLFAPPRMPQGVVQRWYRFIEQCAQRLPTVVVVLGNPFLPVPEQVATKLYTYSDTEPSLVAAALTLSGVEPEWERSQ